MKKILVFFAFILAACQSPPSMFYQRSEYKVQRVGGLMVSTSPSYSRLEFQSTPTHIYLEESWVAQNINSKPVEVFLNKASAMIKDKSYSLSCNEVGQTNATVNIAPGEKVVIRCLWSFPKSSSTKSDLWVTFNLPLSSGETISSNKIVRAEDFL